MTPINYERLFSFLWDDYLILLRELTNQRQESARRGELLTAARNALDARTEDLRIVRSTVRHLYREREMLRDWYSQGPEEPVRIYIGKPSDPGDDTYDWGKEWN